MGLARIHRTGGVGLAAALEQSHAADLSPRGMSHKGDAAGITAEAADVVQRLGAYTRAPSSST